MLCWVLGAEEPVFVCTVGGAAGLRTKSAFLATVGDQLWR